MKATTRLKLRDVRDIHRIVGECGDQWADPAGWRGCLLKGAMRLVGGDSAAWVEIETDTRGVPVGQGATQAVLADCDRRIFEAAIQAGTRGEVQVPTHGPMMAEFARRGKAVGVRQRYVDDEAWYRSSWWNDYRRAAGVDQQVMAMRRIARRQMLVLTIDRANGRGAFDLRTARCLDLLHAELLKHRGTHLATEGHRSLHGLAPRLRQTLECLLEGDSERQAAIRLRISPTTIHGYVGQLHKHFDVSSRGELLAYFIQRKPTLVDKAC